MSKTGEILGLLAIIIAGVVAFPDQVMSVLNNKFYMLIGAVLLLLVIFIIWIRMRTRY